jgi:DNA-binding GntR family transcriptional regulator
LLAHDRAYLEALHAPLNVLYPDERHQRVVKLDARLHLAIRRADLNALTATVAIIRRHPAITMFLTHDAGYLVLLMAAQAMTQAPHTADDETSYTHIAQELGVSRTHVRKLFVAAERSGFVTLSPKGGRVTDIRSPLWNAFDHYLADMEASRDAIAQAAFANLQVL